MKLILCIFEQLSGIKIFFHKSDFCFCFEKQRIWKMITEFFFGYEAGAFPIRYLGIPVHFWRLKISKWKPVQDHFEK
jgi:hypothetical protein